MPPMIIRCHHVFDTVIAHVSLLSPHPAVYSRDFQVPPIHCDRNMGRDGVVAFVLALVLVRVLMLILVLLLLLMLMLMLMLMLIILVIWVIHCD
jgi:hypothetical protein